MKELTANEIIKQLQLIKGVLESQRGNKRDSLVTIDDNYVDLSEVSFISSLDIRNNIKYGLGLSVLYNPMVVSNFYYKVISYKKPIEVNYGYKLNDIFPELEFNKNIDKLDGHHKIEYADDIYSNLFSKVNEYFIPKYQSIFDTFILEKERHHIELLGIWSGIKDLSNIKRF
jgi:hypothetical protein